MKRLDELGISPTPWKMEYSEDIDRVVNILDANNKIIVETDYGFYPPELPDARMMKAAPKIYDAAERYIRFYEESVFHGNRMAREILADRIKAYNDLKAALAEASGESEVKQ